MCCVALVVRQCSNKGSRRSETIFIQWMHIDYYFISSYKTTNEGGELSLDQLSGGSDRSVVLNSGGPQFDVVKL